MNAPVLRSPIGLRIHPAPSSSTFPAEPGYSTNHIASHPRLYPDLSSSHRPPHPKQRPMSSPFSSASSAFSKRGYHTGFPYGGWHPWRRAPSRIVWFVVGAVSAALWIKHRDHDLRKHYGRCRRVGVESMTTESSPVPPFAQEAAAAAPAPPAASAHVHWGPSHYPLPHPSTPGWSPPAPVEKTSPEAGAPAQPPLQALKAAFDGWEKNQDELIGKEKEHMAKVSRQALDAMVELTEATLESVLSTAEALKVKLAEHKAQREKEQKVIEAQIEEQRRNPPRLV